MTGSLLDRVSRLVIDAKAAARTREAERRLAVSSARLSEPLRIGLVGRVKAGKSTLVNALVGEEVAATDAAECTQVVTWYRHGAPRAMVQARNGAVEQRQFKRRTGAVEIDLGRPPQDVDRVEVWLPNPKLRTHTLIDTPGLASLSVASDRTLEFLGSDTERPTDADAVVYLLRHVHASDLRFLDSFQEDDLVQGTPLNTVGVLSRADEVGLCRRDAMDTAGQVAIRYMADDRLGRLCPVIVPVAGLLACAGETWREDEFRALARIASASKDELGDLLLSADALVSDASRINVTPLERQHLLGRLGLFGVRFAVQLIRSGQAANGGELARKLTAHSGIPQLREVIATQFLGRAQMLKARSALAVVESALAEEGCANGDQLRRDVESIRASAHEFTELRLLQLLRSGRVFGKPERIAELERLLGGSGHAPHLRLGVPADSSGEEMRAAGHALLTRCRTLAEHVMTSQELRRVATGAARSCEGVLAQLDSTPSPSDRREAASIRLAAGR